MEYTFTTVWHFDSNSKKVWEELKDIERWPIWWRGFQSVIQKDSSRFIVRVGYFFYTYRFEVTFKINEKIKTIYVSSRGELIGLGKIVVDNDRQSSQMEFDWKVRVNKKWVNIIEKICYPIFILAHNILMTWGAKGLARHKHIKLLKIEYK